MELSEEPLLHWNHFYGDWKAFEGKCTIRITRNIRLRCYPLTASSLSFSRLGSNRVRLSTRSAEQGFQWSPPVTLFAPDIYIYISPVMFGSFSTPERNLVLSMSMCTYGGRLVRPALTMLSYGPEMNVTSAVILVYSVIVSRASSKRKRKSNGSALFCNVNV